MITRIFVQQVYLIYSNDAVFLLLKLNVWFVLQFCFKVFYFKTSKSVYNFSYHLIWKQKSKLGVKEEIHGIWMSS